MERASLVNRRAESDSPTGRTVRLLHHILSDGETSNLSELSRATGITRVTAMRLLADLEAADLVERRPGGGHSIGMMFLKLSALALSGEGMPSLARKVTAALSTELGLSSYFVVPEGRSVLYLVRQMPERLLVSNISIGSMIPAHLTAPGRVLLALMTPEALRELLGDEPFESATIHNPTTYSDLERVLDEDRDRGCAWSFSGFEAGIDACAAAVVDREGRGVGAISTAGPSERFRDDPDFRDRTRHAVIAAANDLSLLLRGM
ncbi:IclR family transcriptional regulator [Homoserinimonas sp. A447]